MSEFLSYQLRRLRKENKMTQGDLAKSANVSQQTISNIESGKTTNPDPALLETLSKILGGSLSMQMQEKSCEISLWQNDDISSEIISVSRLDADESIIIPSIFWRSLVADKDPKMISAWRHQGDAMSPTLHHFDDVLIDTVDTDVKDGSLYLFSYDADFIHCQIKRIFLLPNNVYQLHSDGDKEIYPPICVDSSDIFIAGKVIAVSSLRKL